MPTLAELEAIGYGNDSVDPVAGSEVKQRGLRRSAEQNPFLSTYFGTLKGTVGGGSLQAAGNIVGALGAPQLSKTLYAKGAELQADAQPYIAPQIDYKNVKGLRSALDFVKANAGMGLGSMLPIAVGAAVGGAPAGVAAAYLPQHGENVMRLKEDPTLAGLSEAELASSVVPAAGAQAALDYLVPGGVISKAAEKAAVKAGTGIVGKAAATVGANAATEGAVEGGQQLIQQGMHTALNPNRDKSGDTEELIQNVLGGAVGGGAMGAAHAVPQAVGDLVSARSGSQKELDIKKERADMLGKALSGRDMPEGLTPDQEEAWLSDMDARTVSDADAVAQHIMQDETASEASRRTAEGYVNGGRSADEAELFLREARRRNTADQAFDKAKVVGGKIREALGKLGDNVSKRLGSAYVPPSVKAQQARDNRMGPNKPIDIGLTTTEGPEYDDTAAYDKLVQNLGEKSFLKRLGNALEPGLSDYAKSLGEEATVNGDDSLMRQMREWIKTDFGSQLNNGNAYLPESIIKEHGDEFLNAAKVVYAAMHNSGEAVPGRDMAYSVFEEVKQIISKPELIAEDGNGTGSTGQILDSDGNPDDGEFDFESLNQMTSAHDPNVQGSRTKYYGVSDKNENAPFRITDEPTKAEPVIPHSKLKITLEQTVDGKTVRKQVNARKALAAAQSEVERYSALMECIK